MRKTRRSVVLPLIAAAVLASLLLVFFGCRLLERKRVQSEAVLELSSRAGEYDPQSIVLRDTNRLEAQALAEKLGAKLRITKDGHFATLTLEEGRTIADVFSDDRYLSELGKLSADWSISMAALEDDPEEIDAETLLESRARRPEYAVSDSYYSAQTWLNYMNMSSVWSVTKGGGVTVAVIDSGIDTDHPEFAGRISEWSYNASEDKIVKDYNDWSLIEDEYGHGTAVAGVIGAAMDGSGTVGVAPEVTLLVIKADVNPGGSIRRSSDVVFGLYYAIERDADVVNMSFGSEVNSFAAALQLAVDSDIICIASAGNESSAAPHYPAADPNCIGVGALEDRGWGLADYSNYGESVDVAAPGTTLTTAAGGEYQTQCGTSLSAPAVAGAVALYLSRNRYTEYRDLREVLLASSFDLGDLGPDFYFGYGAADVSALVLEEKGTITFDYLTDELDATTQVFVRSHTLQNIPEPERLYAVFDGWYYDDQCTDEFDWYQDRFTEDLTLYAGWANEDDGIPYTYVELADGTIEIRSYTGHRRYIIIPTHIEGKVVTSIGERAFMGNSRLRQVTLPDQLVQIKSSAFKDCANLVNITIPDSVTSIGSEAFRNDVSLSHASFGSESRLRALGNYAFSNCRRFSGFSLPASLTEMNGSAFNGATGITAFHVSSGNSAFVTDGGVLYNTARTSVVAYPAGLNDSFFSLPDSVTEIGQYAFSHSLLTGIDLNHVTRIEKSAFTNSKLLSVDLQNVLSIADYAFFGAELHVVELRNVMVIGDYAFTYTNLHSLTIPDTVSALGEGAFSYNSLLTSIELGRGITEIPEKLFFYCDQLDIFTIPQEITFINESAFEGAGMPTVLFEENSELKVIGGWAFCGSSLQTINLPNKLSTIDKYAFSGTFSLSEVTFSPGSTLKCIGDYAFSMTPSLKTIELSEGLIELGEHAFFCGGLTEITLPPELTILGRGAFAKCNELTSIRVNERNSAYLSISGVVYTTDGKTVMSYPCGATTASYEILEGTETVYREAFHGAHNLKGVTLPESLTEIGIQGFFDCGMLENILITDNVIQIGRLAFGEDWMLNSIAFQSLSDSKLSRIGFMAFAECGIRSFTVPSNVSSMAQYAFNGCRNLSSVTFAENSKLASVSAYIFDGCSNLQTVDFAPGSALTSLQAHAFDGLPSLRSVNFGNAPLENIDNFAFRSCTSLTDFQVPEGVRYLGRYAFYQCSSLAEVSLPSTLEFIGRYAFLASKNAQLYFSAEVLPETLQEGWDGGTAGYYLGVQSVSSSGDWKYAQLSSGGIALLEYSGSAKSLDLSALGIGTVTNIGGKVFAFSGVEQIVIPETVTVIQREAFYSSALKALSLPASVTFIGQKAFAHTPIEALTFAEGSRLNTIERSAFEGTERLSSVTIPAGVTNLGSAAFKRSGISSLSFESGISLTEISKEAFAYTNITSLTIPDSVAVIRDNAFRETKALETVSFGMYPDLKIRANAFYLSGLKSLTIPENVTYIGECAFTALKNLTAYQVAASNPYYQAVDGLLLSKDGRKLINVPAGRTGSLTVPADVEVIGFGAFENSCLSSVGFPQEANILTIGYRAFFGAENLTSITIPASVISIDYYAFAYCENLKTVTFAEGSKLNVIYEGAFCGDISLKDIVLPDSTIEICEYLFYGCESLKSLPLQNAETLEEIDSYAFAYSGLTGEMTLPESLVEIGEHAFHGTPLTSVTVPTTRQEELQIGCGAFQDCINLEAISVPFIGSSLDDLDNSSFGFIFGSNQDVPKQLKIVSITGKQSLIGPYAFYQINTIEHVDLPDSINDIYIGAFSGTIFPYGFENEIRIVGENIEHYHFSNSNLTGELRLSAPIYDIGYDSFSGCAHLKSVILPEGLKTIDHSAFSGCTELKEIRFPESLTSIGGGAFRGCTGLNRVSFSGGKTDIGQSAFRNCTGLESLILAGGTIGIEAFKGCSALSDISFCEGLTLIDLQAFMGCQSLISIVLPDGLERIEEGAFYDCRNLFCVTLPKGLSFIGEDAFSPARVGVVINKSGLKLSFQDTENGLVSYGAYKIVSPDGTVEYHPDYYETADGFLCKHNEYDDDFLLAYLGQEETVTLPTDLNGKPYRMEGVRGIKNVIIPEGTDKINYGAFINVPELESISLPESLTSIEFEAFCRSGLETIILPDGLTSIGQRAFLDCRNLEKLSIPSSVMSIGTDAFQGCTSLTLSFANDSNSTTIDGVVYNSDYTSIVSVLPGVTEVVVPSGVTSIPSRAFAECYSLKSITLPEGLQSIEAEAFLNCSDLKTIILPNSLSSIERRAFSGCRCLTELVCPDSLTSIGESAFAACSALKKVVFPQGLITIGMSAFYHCVNLTKIELPDSLSDLGSYAFQGCSALKNVSLPQGLSRVGASCFADCRSLSEIRLPNSLSIINDGMFANCVALENMILPQELSSIGRAAFSGCQNLTYLSLPDSLTKIGNYAFSNCTALQYLYIPKNVSMIGINPFQGCTSLQIEFAPDQNYFAEKDGVVYNGSYTELLFVLPKINPVISIPSSVESIPNRAFNQCSGLEELTLPDSITELPESAFSDCGNLKRVSLPKTLKRIGNYTFNGCVQLQEIVFPEGLKSIGIGAFQSCESLLSVTLPQSLEMIEGGAFNACSALFSLVNHSGLELEFGSITNGDVARYALIIVEADQTTRLKEFCFETEDGFIFEQFRGSYRLRAYNGDKETVTLPRYFNGYEYAIYRMQGVKNAILPEGFLGVPSQAFMNCRMLESITLPQTCQSIGSEAFSGCQKLESVSLPYIRTIEERAFFCCTELRSVEVSDALVRVASKAFYGCKKLIDFNMPGSISNLYSDAFDEAAFYDANIEWEDGYAYLFGYIVSRIGSSPYMNPPRENTRGIVDSAYKDAVFIYSSLSGRFPLKTETLVIWNAQITRIPENASNYVVAANSSVRSPNAFKGIKGVTIWVERPENECSWDENYPGWNNGNPVFYADKWSYSSFYDLDGTLIYKTPRRNSAVVFRPYYRPMDEQYIYSIGWDLDGDGTADAVPATSPDDITARAVITGRTLRSYSISFLSHDGTLLSSQSCAYGSLPVAPAAPERASENPNRYEYVFAGWDREISPVSGEETYTAVYTRVLKKHTPGDVNWDGKVNNVDAILLFRYLSDIPVDIDPSVIDINGDGMVNNMDAIILFRYLSGADVTLH